MCCNVMYYRLKKQVIPKEKESYQYSILFLRMKRNLKNPIQTTRTAFKIFHYQKKYSSHVEVLVLLILMKTLIVQVLQ